MPDVDALTFGRRLRHHRKEAGLTLAALGELVGRPVPFLSMLENGRRQPRPDHITQLARALGVPGADLIAPEAPSLRAGLEIELERVQKDSRFNHLDLPYVRPSPALSDEILRHLVGLYRALDGRIDVSGQDVLREANASVAAYVRTHDGYLSDLEAVAAGILGVAGHHSDGPLSSRSLLDIADHLGFTVEAVEDMVPGTRSVTDGVTGRIYIAQRNELRTRQARKAVLQTLAGRLLGHTEPRDIEDFLRQRMETAYLAGAILVPERAAVRRLRAAAEQRDISVEDLKENFYVSYEMASWRFVNLATERLGVRTHLIVTGEDGLIVKGYANDGLGFVTDEAGGIERQPACRYWGAVAVFASADKYDVHAQYTETPAGSYFCTTHMEPDRPYAVTVGVPEGVARRFRHHDTTRRATSTCPDLDCCRRPTEAQLERWDGKIAASVRSHSRLLGLLAPDPRPEPVGRAVYELVERHSP